MYCNLTEKWMVNIVVKERKITFLKIAIFIIGLTVLSLCIFLLPALAREAAVMNPEYAYLQYPVLFGLYATAIPFFLALYKAFKMLTYIEREEAFSEFFMVSLRYIKNCALTIICLYVIGIIVLGGLNALHPGIAIIGIGITFTAIVIVVFSAILQKMLRSAIELKAENDLIV
jgi:Protein of unknown function (DUF2975)